MNKCYWVTGLSATGKTTLSSLLVTHLRDLGKTVVHLDGDELRHVLADEAYTREERIALAMRYARFCKLLSEQGIDVVIAVIGLFKEVHKWNRDNITNYIEIFIDTPLSELKKRDPKKLYRDVELGVIKNVAGIDLIIDIPSNPDIHLKWSDKSTIDSMFNELVRSIQNRVDDV
jgi:cytidine diphosphoramidate kinase